MRHPVLGALLAAGIFATSAAAAQEPGLGSEFPVNTYTTALQSNPAVASKPSDGDFIIVWQTVGQEGGPSPNLGIFGQRYDFLGTPIGGEMAINLFTYYEQHSPRIAMDGNGNFIVVWAGGQGSISMISDLNGVGGRTFDSNGNPVQSFTVNDPTKDPEDKPAVAMNDGGFVVAFQRTVPLFTGADIFAQRYETDGDRIGGNFQVNTYTTGQQMNPEVALGADGHFMVTWTTDGDIRGRVYDETGTPLGDDFQVNTHTTGVQYNHSIATDGAGGFVVVWNDNDVGYPMRAQRFDGGGNPSGPEKVVGAATLPRVVRRANGGFALFYFRAGANIWSRRLDDSLELLGSEFQINDVVFGGIPTSGPAIADLGRHLVYVWGTPENGFDVRARRGGYPDWAPFRVDARAATAGTSNVNGVIEVGERVTVDQAYLNRSGLPYPLAGTASNWTGPAGLTYSIHDASAAYGTVASIASGADAPAGIPTSDCFTATGNCFEFEVTGSRPGGVHLDTTYDEALSEAVSITRTIHLGESFLDVLPANIFYPFVENLLHNGITAGGACGGYCPFDGVKRQQMAVFLLKSKNGAAYIPPQPTGTIFADVPITHQFGNYIEDLYNQGVTGGCATNPLQFCPDAIVNRQQMAVFLLKAEEGSAFDPPDCAGIFTDVPCTPGIGFSDYIEELYNRQITGGCVAVPLQYCPTNTVTRGQMSAFLVKNFGLVLYGR